MSKEFSIKTSVHGAWQILTLSGPLNEDSSETLKSMTSKVGKQVLIDFAAVVSVNSCGIAEWIQFIDKLPKGTEVVYDRCPSHVVSTMNLMPSLLDRAKVRSVQRTYVCPSNHKKTTIIQFDVTKRLAVPNSGTIPCDRCGQTMEPETPDEDYFEFASAG